MEPRIFKCPCCGASFQHGTHRYEGKYIPRYEVLVCRNCYESNREGWANDKWLLEHLKSRNIPIPNTNTNGVLPRGD